MLKKLFKYDWKSFWKVPAAINLFLVLITIIGILSFYSPVWRTQNNFIDVLMVSSMMLYLLTIFAGSIGILVYTAIRYYKNVYTDEGYLTNTLPVTPRQIILSKMLNGVIWYLITYIVIAVSVFSLTFSALNSYEHINLFVEIKNGLAEASLMFAQEVGISLSGFIVFIIISCIIGSFFSVIMAYSSISLGQLFTKHKAMGAVIWYIAEYIIVQMGTSLLMNVPFGISLFKSGGITGTMIYPDLYTKPIMYLKPIMIGSLIITLILSVVFFFISEYMLKKKLNLD